MDNLLYLVMPPQPGLLAGFATGLLSIRRYLSLHVPAQRVEVIDCSAVEEKDILQHLLAYSDEDEKSVFLGITTTTATYQSALAVARAARNRWGRRAVILLGGPHASSDPVSVLNRHAGLVDFVIVGEGERSLEAFLRAWPEVTGVPGLAYHHHARVEVNPASLLLGKAELDTLTIDEDWFSLTGHPGKFDAFTYVSARGCPLKCAFCSVSNQAIRAKSPAVLAQEVAAIVRHGYRRIAIEDNFFAHNSRRTREVCAELEALRPSLPSFEWDCQTRVESVARPEMVSQLASAGCTAVYLGVEALAPEALRFLGKAVNADRYIELVLDTALPRLFEASMGVNINIQFGMPEEAGDYLDQTISRLIAIGQQAAAHDTFVTIFPQLFVVYPGTGHFQRFIDDATLWPEVFEDFTSWERNEDELVYWMGRYFAHGIGGIPLGLLERDALRRRRFRVDPRPLLDIERRLDALGASAGLNVFSYTRHLAPAAQRITRTSHQGAIQ